MGVLTEICIADKEDAPALKEELHRCEKWMGIDAKGHNEITLSELWSVLDPAVSAESAEDCFALLTEDGPDGPWVYLVPEELTKLLSATEDHAIPDVHKRWLNQEEIGHHVTDDEDARCVLQNLNDLVDLAKKAVEQGKPLLMWICL